MCSDWNDLCVFVALFLLVRDFRSIQLAPEVGCEGSEASGRAGDGYGSEKRAGDPNGAESHGNENRDVMENSDIYMYPGS